MESLRFDTIPSSPILQAWAKTVGPSPSICSLNRMPAPSLGHDRCERGLADLKRITPQIVAVQFDQVEGVEKYALVSALVTDQIERRNAVVIAGDSFAVDNAGARAQASQCLDDQREAAGEVVAGTAVEPHLCALLAGDDAEAVVLDFVNPQAAGRQCVRLSGEARRMNPGREGAHTQHNVHS